MRENREKRERERNNDTDDNDDNDINLRSKLQLIVRHNHIPSDHAIHHHAHHCLIQHQNHHQILCWKYEKQAKSPHAFNKIVGCELVKPKMQEAFLG